MKRTETHVALRQGNLGEQKVNRKTMNARNLEISGERWLLRGTQWKARGARLSLTGLRVQTLVKEARLGYLEVIGSIISVHWEKERIPTYTRRGEGGNVRVEP